MFRQKKVVSLLCALFMVSALLLVPLDVKASNNGLEIFVSYAEPVVSDSQGYLNVLMKNKSTGLYFVNTFFWNINSAVNGQESSAYADIVLSSGSIQFTVGGTPNSGTTVYYHLASFGSDGKINEIKKSSTEACTVNFSSSYECVGYKYKGNVGAFKRNPDFSEYIDYTVYFSSDSSAILLRDIFNVLNETAGLNADIYNAVYSIYNSVDSVESKLEGIISYLKSVDSELTSISSQLNSFYTRAGQILEEQKETNTWLEKIFDYLNESQEQQKQEAQTQGGNSVSQGNSAIEDKGGDFASSLGGLTNSMSYTGTQCAWTFPEVKLPAIPGVMDEVVLIRSQPIDFSVWVNAIPPSILLLIQSVLTMALIVYCFKELYGTISYVLTLRGGGDNE